MWQALLMERSRFAACYIYVNIRVSIIKEFEKPCSLIWSSENISRAGILLGLHSHYEKLMSSVLLTFREYKQSRDSTLLAFSPVSETEFFTSKIRSDQTISQFSATELGISRFYD